MRLVLSSAAVGVCIVAAMLAQSPANVNWAINGGEGNSRFSPLTQIDKSNVASLQVAWTYDSHDAFTASEMQSNPVVIDGVLYATTPTMKVGLLCISEAVNASWLS
jgi:quinoprotein glucose dehydrogenase